MELMSEIGESSEIFEDCNNRETKQADSSSDSKLVENCNESGKNQIYNTNSKINNNHHVVPAGIIILLLTIYLGMTSVQKCLVNCVEENIVKEQELFTDLYKPTYKENSIILERLLEYKDICKDLEIFTKNKNLPKEDADNKKSTYEILKQLKAIRGGEDASSFDTDNNDVSGYSGSGSCLKDPRNKNKKSKYAIKSSPKTKNGFNKYNKSSKAKYNKNINKKELNLNKKNSTAEPIIYLFALVFIYLLLKAASDINQHYKSQNKNDKRLRRCSLQSYAQTHRPDRRASKGISAKSLPKF